MEKTAIKLGKKLLAICNYATINATKKVHFQENIFQIFKINFNSVMLVQFNELQ